MYRSLQSALVKRPHSSRSSTSELDLVLSDHGSTTKLSHTTPRSVPPIPSVLPQGTLELVPPVGHLIAHLKLIRTFVRLQNSMAPQCWAIYQMNALRRFIWYITLLKTKLKHRARYTNEQSQLATYHMSKNAKFCNHTLSSQLPPIDILFIWYCLLLRSTSFYELGVRNLFLEFTFFPFPLLIAGNAINNQYKYSPPSQMVENFTTITDRKIGWKQLLITDINKTPVVPVICPGCFQQLSTIQISKLHKLDTVCSCKCRFQGNLTIQQLRKRQLYADIIGEKPLPLLYLTVSTHLFEDGAPVDELDQSIKSVLKENGYHNQLKQPGTSLADFFELSGLDVNYRRVFLEHYSNISCLVCTVPQSNPVQVTDPYFFMREDFLAKCSKTTEELDLFDLSIFECSKLTSAVDKYIVFYKMLLELFRGYSLVPLVDIDLVWQTHKLSPYRYIEFSKVHCHKNVIDTAEALLIAFAHTCQLYKAVRHLEYTDCQCSYCFHGSKLRRSSRYLVSSDVFLDRVPCETVSNSGTSIVRTLRK